MQQPTNLVKYCKAEHLDAALKYGKIFVGTFEKYKKIENNALQDMEEGMATPAILDHNDDLLLSESDNDGMLRHSSIKLANDWKVELPKNMPLWLDTPAFNTFIFCVSLDENPSIEKAQRLGYDSFYIITDPLNFGRAVMEGLRNHLESKYGFNGDMGSVKYVPRKIHIINDSHHGMPTKNFSKEDFFTKNETFSEDREFRYVFYEYSDEQQTQYNSLNIDGLIIENMDICKWLKI